jgi:hypothetical protein
MNRLLILFLLIGESAIAQTKPEASVPSAIVSVIEDLTSKRFVADTAFAALSKEDQTLLAKEPIANWGLLQEQTKKMAYSNLIIGTRSYQLVITRPPKSDYPTATLLRYTTPQSKPEPIARGSLQPRIEEKGK